MGKSYQGGCHGNNVSGLFPWEQLIKNVTMGTAYQCRCFRNNVSGLLP